MATLMECAAHSSVLYFDGFLLEPVHVVSKTLGYNCVIACNPHQNFNYTVAKSLKSGQSG